MTPNGRFIAFVANSNGTSGTTTCVCVWEAPSGAATLASGNLSNTVPVGSTCDWPDLDFSGRFVAFECPDASLVPNDRNHDYDVFVRDVASKASELISARI